MKTTTPYIHNISLIYASELFEKLSGKVQNELWDNCPYSFGDCNFSLIHPVHVEHWIETLDFDNLSIEDKDAIKTIFESLKEYAKDGIHIDIEC